MYPKNVTKECKGCGSKKTFNVKNYEEKEKFYFCCDECAEEYYYRSCKTKAAARSKISVYYNKKGIDPDRFIKPLLPYLTDKLLNFEQESKEKVKTITFKQQLAILDAEYRTKLRRSYGLKGE